MSDFFETRVENLEPREDKKKTYTAVKKSPQEKPSRKPRRGKGKTPTPVTLSLAKNLLKIAVKAKILYFTQ